MVKKSTDEPLQGSLGLMPAKKARQKSKAPEPPALRATQVVDCEPATSHVSAALLLDWLKPNLQQDFGLQVTPRSASLLLQIFPPTICAHGQKRWGCGNTQLSTALLQLLPVDELVEVRYIDPEHPLACVQLPIHLLLKCLPVQDLLPTLNSLAKLLGEIDVPNQEDLATTLGVSQSTISRSLKKMEKTTK